MGNVPSEIKKMLLVVSFRASSPPPVVRHKNFSNKENAGRAKSLGPLLSDFGNEGRPEPLTRDVFSRL